MSANCRSSELGFNPAGIALDDIMVFSLEIDRASGSFGPHGWEPRARHRQRQECKAGGSSGRELADER